MFLFWRLPSSSSTALVILGGVQRPQMKVRRHIAMLFFIIVVVLLVSHLHRVIENVTCTIGFHSGHFSARLKWTLNVLSLGSIIVWLVISSKIGKLRRTWCQCCTYVVVHSNSGFVVRIFFVVHRFSTFAVFNPLKSLLALIVSPTVRDDTPHCSFYRLLSFGLLLVTMSSQTSSSRRNSRITCFPGDPWYAAMKLTATATEFSCLSRKEFLSTAVLDSILQHMALPQDNASEEIMPPMIGSLGCDAWMTASNYNASLTRKEASWNSSRVEAPSTSCH